MFTSLLETNFWIRWYVMCSLMINTVCAVDSRVVCQPILQTDRALHQQMFDITSTIQSTFN
jgi:hypothetical protein